MRLQKKTPDDDKLRVALENMRYGACTAADLQFLRTRTVGNGPDAPILNSARFCHVSVITAFNVHKDAFNYNGAIKFAHNTGQKLTHFRSVDKLSIQPVDKKRWPKSVQSTITSITKAIQEQLWNATPCTSEHVPGTLSLCIGMPVMLRSNDATELCITKGQEATVVGWDAVSGSAGEDILDTLFVKLKTPPKDVQLDGLPLNVVPLPRASFHVTCLLQDDTLVSVTREQVSVLLNFAMTDYGSQGKSRPENVVDLRNCFTHMSCYVALSRGTSSAGTVIIQGVDMKRVTSGATGYLRQELREIEILDEITRLRFEGILPRTVTGLYRRSLLRSYQLWKGEHYESQMLHPSLRWQSDMGPKIPEMFEYGQWSATAAKRSTESRQAKTVNMLKRPADEELLLATKRTKTVQPAGVRSYPKGGVPVGLIWDSVNFSCAYDATFGILCNIWLDNIAVRSAQFKAMSPELHALAEGFDSVLLGNSTLEQVRDTIRMELHNRSPGVFPNGPNGTSIDALFLAMLSGNRSYGLTGTKCGKCNHVAGTAIEFVPHLSITMGSLGGNGPISLAKWLKHHLKHNTHLCPRCLAEDQRRRVMTKSTTLTSVPPLMFTILDNEHISIDSDIKLNCAGRRVSLKLRGVIYHGFKHFTARIITPGGGIWFHDGMTTRSSTVSHGNMRNDSEALHFCEGRKAVAAIYALH
ncbi:hypothetical protein B0H11DRAFT_1712356 [Mycena galericulata]|nr:hypothetical protein B0H11DRAFT_1712356 [Mycena galericulata]